MPNLQDHPTPSAVEGCCALCVDSTPTEKGRSWYIGPYLTSDDPVEGFATIARTLLRMEVIGDNGVARSCRTYESVSRRMRERNYYEGQTTDKNEAILAHCGALMRHGKAIASILGRSEGLGVVLPTPYDVEIAIPPPWKGPPPEISWIDDLEARISLTYFESLIEDAREGSRKERDSIVCRSY